MREAGQVSCASAIAAMHRSTLCLLLGLLGAAPPGQAAGFDFASLQSLLSHQDIGSVEKLIAALPAAQRNRYALVFESRSLQGASPENPRVILYGPDARFIVTFSGSPAQRGFRVVETMEFDDDSKEFRLRELLFPERAAGPDKVVVSEVNPQRCTRSHRTPSSPFTSAGCSRSPSRANWYGSRLSSSIDTHCSVSRTPPAGGSRISIPTPCGAPSGPASSASPATAPRATPGRRNSKRRAPRSAARPARWTGPRVTMPWCSCASWPSQLWALPRKTGRWRLRRGHTISRCLPCLRNRCAKRCWQRSRRATPPSGI